MATQVQNSSTLIDALADALGRPPRTVEQKTAIVENFTRTRDSVLTNEQKARNFNTAIAKHIRDVVRANAEWYAAQSFEDDISNAGDTAAGDL